MSHRKTDKETRRLFVSINQSQTQKLYLPIAHRVKSCTCVPESKHVHVNKESKPVHVYTE